MNKETYVKPNPVPMDSFTNLQEAQAQAIASIVAYREPLRASFFDYMQQYSDHKIGFDGLLTGLMDVCKEAATHSPYFGSKGIVIDRGLQIMLERCRDQGITLPINPSFISIGKLDYIDPNEPTIESVFGIGN